MLAIGVSLSAIAVPQVAFGQSCTPDVTTGLCELTVTDADQTITLTAPSHVINLATSTTVTQASNFPAVLLENRAGASLDTVTLVNPTAAVSVAGLTVARSGAVLVNSGTVEGDVVLRGGTYIANGGTVTGNVVSAAPTSVLTEYFIDRSGGNLGVAGVIDPGAGVDVFVKSFSQSAQVELPAALPTNFELRGVEALGADTTVTIANPSGVASVSGLSLAGNGSVINRAVIDNLSFAGVGLPPSAVANVRTRAVSYSPPTGATGTFALIVITPIGPVSALIATTGNALASFANEGTINGDILVNTASFTNTGTINLLSNQAGTLIQGSAATGLDFVNRGTVTMTDNGLRIQGNALSYAITASTALDSLVGKPVSFLNDSNALIAGGVAIGGLASTLRFENRGQINGTGNPNLVAQFNPAVSVGWSDFGPLPIGDRTFSADSVTLINSGTIGGGLIASGVTRAGSFVNSGTIASAGPNDRAIELGVESAVDANDDFVADGQTFSFSNTGTISGANELELSVTDVTISNSGQISVPASQGLTTFPGGAYGLLISQETVLGSTLSFTNSGTIESAGAAGAGVLIGAEAGDLDSGLAGAAVADANVTITNSGTIRTTGGGFLQSGVFQGLPSNIITVYSPVALGVRVDAEGDGSLTINNTAGATIETVQAPFLSASLNGAITTTNPSGGPAVVAFGGAVAINNDGTIRSGNPGKGVVLPPQVLAGTTRVAYAGYGHVELTQLEGVSGGGIDTFGSVDNVVNGATGLIDGGVALRQGDDTLLNRGSITGNVFTGSGNDRVTNLGTIGGNVDLGVGNDIYITSLKDFTLHNPGTIDGGQGGDSMILLTNDGGSLQDYAAAPRTNFEFVALGGDGTVTSSGDTVLPVVQLAGNLTLGQGSVVNAGQTYAFRSDSSVPLNNAFTSNATINGGVSLGLGDDVFTNNGALTGVLELGDGNDRVSNFGTIDGNVSLGNGNDIYLTALKDYALHNTGLIDGGQGGDSLILAVNGGGSLQEYAAVQRTNFEFVALGGSGTVTSTGDAPLDTVQLAGSVTLAAGSVVNASQPFAFRSDATVPLDNALTNLGTINGSVALGLGNDTFTNYGTFNGSLDLGEGEDTFVQGINAVFTGTADGGAGRDTFTLDITGGGRIPGALYDQLANFEVLGLVGVGQIITDAPLQVETIELAPEGGNVDFGEGSVIQTQGETAITGSTAADTINNAGTINGNVELGDGDNALVNAGTTNGNVVSGTGADNLENSGTINGNVDLGDGDNGFVNGGITTGNIVSGTGADSLQNTGTIEGSVNLGDGANAFVNAGTTNGDVVSGTGSDSLANAGMISGNVGTGAGSDTVSNDGQVSGSVDTGDGDDTLGNSGTIGGDVDLDGAATPVAEQSTLASASGIRLAAVAAEVVPVSGGNDVFTSSGAIGGSVNAGAGDDSFTLSGSVGGSVDMGDDQDSFTLAATGTVAGSVDMGAGDDVIVAAGSIGGSLFGGGGTDRVTLSGSVGQAVDLGDGDDVLDLQGAWAIGGTTTGGTGTDMLRLGSSGTEAAPRVLDLAGFQSFEQLDVQAGVNKLTGTASFGAISVTTGRLIGAAGSVLSGNVAVAPAGTFGSAGTVNGNIAVAGVLSPGASPATMTVNGNIALAATSTTVFEFTPTVSDALIVNGSLAIANGAKLTLTGTRPIMPGIYTMVSATQGITGSFGTNVTRDSTVLGVLRQTANTIELIGQFQLQGGASAQAVATKDYLNALLVAGQASSGVVDAFPALVGADGFARAAQLQTLSPEPYADAAQLGIENGLAIARALRQAPLTGQDENSGLFVFGQAYGSWRKFAGDARGVARGDIDSSGFLGGIGYGTDAFGLSLFVGRSDSRQRITALGARNDADGLFAGGRLHFALDGVTAGVSVVFDRAEGDTVRNPAVGGTARSHYTLHGTTADAWIGYGAAIGGGWRIGPEVGVSAVSVTRGGIAETGGGAFGLNLRRDHYDAVFVNGSLKLQGPDNGRVRPWIAGGVRHRADGDAITATASLTGATQTFTVGGVERDRTLPFASAGLSFGLGRNASVFLNGDAEFSRSNALQNVTAGVVFRF